MRVTSHRWLALFVAFLGACGSGRSDAPDGASMGDASPGADASSIDVDEPAPLALTPCKEGWVEVTDELGVHCEPWPIGAAPCAGDEVRFPGETECHPIGSPCPSGDFPTDVGGAAIYVDADATPGAGSGSSTDPFATVEEALGMAVSGSIIVLAKGTHLGGVHLTDGVTLRGACAAETTLRAGQAVAGSLGVINVDGRGVRVESVRVTGDRMGLHMNGESGDVEATLFGVVFDALFALGLGVGIGAELHAEDLLVRGTREIPNPSGPRRYGQGLLVSDSASATVQRAVFEGNRGMGIFAGVGGEVTLVRTVIRATREDGDGRFGRGLGVEVDGRAILRETVVEGNHDCAVHVATDSVVEAEDTILRDTLGHRAAAPLGCGIAVRDGAAASLARSRISGNRYYGSSVRDMGSILRLEDTQVVSTEATDVQSGVGLLADGPASVELERVLFAFNHSQGILARGATVSLLDVRVRGTESDPTNGEFGRGIEANRGAQLSGLRTLLEANRDGAVLAFDAGTLVDLRQTVVRDTRERACAEDLCRGFGAGTGVSAHLGASVTLDGFSVARSALAGVQLTEGQMWLRHGEIRENPIGVNIQVSGFDLSQIADSVVYADNDRNLVRDVVDAPAVPSPLP